MCNIHEMAAISSEINGDNPRKHQGTTIQESLPPTKRIANKEETVSETRIDSSGVDPNTSTVDAPKGKKRGRPPNKPKPTEGEKTSSGQEARKRGRPPKLKTSEERKSENMPKKRGRPPKPITPQDANTASLQTTPKKRGRPPKPKPEEDSSVPVVDPQSTEDKTDNILDSNTPVEMPKKRGRPPKSATSVSTSGLHEKREGPHTDSTTEKRRPGRPRKHPVDESMVIEKRKPGRPRKQPVDHSGTPEKRKPGRPRKQQTGQSEGTIKIKRKPGRPPKHAVTLKVGENKDQDDSEESEESDEDSSAEEEVASGRRPRVKKPEPKIYEKESEVHALLKQCGVSNLGKVCKCLKAGIMNGFVTLLPPDQDPEQKYGLNQVIAKGECQVCSAKVKATIKEILYQGDIGLDYETGSENAKIFCPNRCTGMYVGGLCLGDAYTECGKFYNHCTACPRFGTCIYDYRETHCPKCDDHYHGTFGRFECPSCNPTSEDD